MTDKKRKKELPSEEDRVQLPDEPVPAKLTRGRVVVVGEPAAVLYEAGYYGTMKAQGQLDLEPEEVLLLARRQRIQVSDTKGNELEFSDLLEQLAEGRPGLWTRFLVYSDLRSRGYVVRTGYGKGLLFRVYPRGAKLNEATAKYFVCAISEGTPLNVAELDSFSKQAKRNRKKLMLAVLDRQGETTYYLVSPADIGKEK
ncbi:MAG: tRNA-intron lyase [Candidatus Thorarchaeota archaeon]